MSTTLDAVESLDVPSFIVTLNQAAAFRGTGERPNAQAVIAAMLKAEKVAKQQGLTYPLEALLGDWQLCFTTLSKVNGRSPLAGKGIYLPRIAQAQISFSQPAAIEPISCGGEIGNQIQVGSILFRVAGSFHYPGKKNLLIFDFTQMQLVVFGKTLYSGNFRGGDQTISFGQRVSNKLPFFAFFLITENFIAARGRGGGLALWVRSPLIKSAVPE